MLVLRGVAIQVENLKKRDNNYFVKESKVKKPLLFLIMPIVLVNMYKIYHAYLLQEYHEYCMLFAFPLNRGAHRIALPFLGTTMYTTQKQTTLKKTTVKEEKIVETRE